MQDEQVSEARRGAIRAKIVKLMALGKDGAANEHEAEAALRQAAKLMAHYAISEAEIQAKTGHTAEYDFSEGFVPYNPLRPQRNASTWCGVLALGVARLTETRAKSTRHSQRGVGAQFSGVMSDVLYAEYLLGMLIETVRREAARYAGSRRDKEFFRIAMASRISARAKEIRNDMDRNIREAVSGTALTIVRTKAAAVTARYGSLQHEPVGKRYGSASAYAAGEDAGNHVGFGRPVDHHGPLRLAAA